MKRSSTFGRKIPRNNRFLRVRLSSQALLTLPNGRFRPTRRNNRSLPMNRNAPPLRLLPSSRMLPNILTPPPLLSRDSKRPFEIIKWLPLVSVGLILLVHSVIGCLGGSTASEKESQWPLYSLPKSNILAACYLISPANLLLCPYSSSSLALLFS